MEQIIFSIRPSMRPIIVLYVLGLIISIIALAIEFSFLTILAGSVAFVMLIGAIDNHIRRNSKKYTLTSENIRFRDGIVSIKETIIPLPKIQNVTFIYSMNQRLFGTGDIIVESAAEHVGGMRLVNIDKPEERARQILEAVGKIQQKDVGQI